MKKTRVEWYSWFEWEHCQEHFHVCGATGVAEYSMAARDAMIAHATGAHLHIQHLSKEESVKVVGFASGIRSSCNGRSGTSTLFETESLLLTKEAMLRWIHLFAWNLTV